MLYKVIRINVASMTSLDMRHLKVAEQAVQADLAALISAEQISAISLAIFSETFSVEEEEEAERIMAL